MFLNKVENILDEKISRSTSVGGGCICDSYIVDTTNGERYFVKTHNQTSDMFRKEANGLKEIKKSESIRVPEVIGFDDDFLLLEHIGSTEREENFFTSFAVLIAKMHKYTSDSYGFYEDNYVGSSVQKNIPQTSEKRSWAEFYWNNRLMYQFKMMEQRGYVTAELKECFTFLEKTYPEIVIDDDVFPSLIHGDLWSGNFITDNSGEACLIDPAVYYGSREVDLAMMKLFGGFPNEFFQTYNEVFPLNAGWEYRENIYKLYHVMNHLNLFGRGYYNQTISLINSYL